jgi:hypothetical protein
MHFVRLLYWTIYDNSGKTDVAKIERQTFRQTLDAMGNDVYIVPLLLLMYAIAMHFYTAPITQLYKPTFQAFMAPLTIFPLFWFKSWDVMIMCLHLALLNIYTCYYLIDNDAYSAFMSQA